MRQSLLLSLTVLIFAFAGPGVSRDAQGPSLQDSSEYSYLRLIIELNPTVASNHDVHFQIRDATGTGVLVDSGPISVTTLHSSREIADDLVLATQPNSFSVDVLENGKTAVRYRDPSNRDLRCFGRVGLGAWAEIKEYANNFQGVDYSIKAKTPPGLSRDLLVADNPGAASQFYLQIQIRENDGINVIASGNNFEVDPGDFSGQITQMIAESFSSTSIRAKERDFGVRFYDFQRRVFRVYYSMNGNPWNELNARANNLQGVDLTLPQGTEGTLSITSNPWAASNHTMEFQVRDNDGTTAIQTSGEIDISTGDSGSSIMSALADEWGSGPIGCLQGESALTLVDSARRVFRLFARINNGSWFEVNGSIIDIQGILYSYQDPPGGTLIVNLPSGSVTTPHTIQMATFASDGTSVIWGSAIVAVSTSSTATSIAESLEDNWADEPYVLNPNSASVFRNVLTFKGPYFRLFLRADLGAWQEVTGAPINMNGVEYFNSEWRTLGPLQIQLSPTVASSHFLTIEARQMDGTTSLGPGATVSVNPGDSAKTIGQSIVGGWNVEGIQCIWNGASVDLIDPDGRPFRCFGKINSGAWAEIVPNPGNWQGVDYSFTPPIRMQV
jgi:hypothetical protein